MQESYDQRVLIKSYLGPITAQMTFEFILLRQKKWQV